MRRCISPETRGLCLRGDENVDGSSNVVQGSTNANNSYNITGDVIDRKDTNKGGGGGGGGRGGGGRWWGGGGGGGGGNDAPKPERYTIDIYNSISFKNKLHLECDLNGLQYVPITLTQGTSKTFTVDVDLPKPGGNYVLSCFMDYGAGKYYGDSWVFFDYQRDKSRCANKRCTWQINENGAFLLLRFYEWEEEEGI
uniref:S-protein homolog n=1 Tax=Solanum tuberosum TaxID=4113 RepID=M1CW87_SOLTU